MTVDPESEQEADTLHSWPVFANTRPVTGFPRFKRPSRGTHLAPDATNSPSSDSDPEPSKELSAAEQQALREASEQGYAAGLESGKQAAVEAQARIVSELHDQCARVQEQLQNWTALLEQTFAERCIQALNTIVGERLQVQPSFFAELLQRAAQELHSDIESLQLEVAPDLEGALRDDIVAVVNAELDPGEIRIGCGPRVAQLPLAELVAEMLSDLPTVAEQDAMAQPNPEQADDH